MRRRHHRRGKTERAKDIRVASQIDVAPHARQTVHTPGVQVDRGLEQKAVMGLHLDLGCLRTGAGFRGEVVWAVLIANVICGLLHRRLWWRWLLWLRDRGSDGDRRGDG